METAEDRAGLGQVIRTLRDLHDWSRADLAREAELSPVMIQKIEQGAKSPSTRALGRLARALGVDAVELTTRGQTWATLLSRGAATTTLLRQVAGGAIDRVNSSASPLENVAALRSLNRVKALDPVVVREVLEAELRAALEERLAQAKTREELDAIAAALNAGQGSQAGDE